MNSSLVGRPDALTREKKRKTNQKNWKKKTSTSSSHPEPCIPTAFLSPLSSTQEGQTSTDWIWFICARIIWTLLRIFFWWPANVTPTLRMSLWQTQKQQTMLRWALSCLTVWKLLQSQKKVWLTNFLTDVVKAHPSITTKTNATNSKRFCDLRSVADTTLLAEVMCYIHDCYPHVSWTVSQSLDGMWLHMFKGLKHFCGFISRSGMVFSHLVILNILWWFCSLYCG